MFDSIFGIFAVGGVGIATLIAIAWFIPPLRKLAIQIGIALIAGMAIYGKGVRDRAALEQKRKDEAVAKARADYEKIDARPDTDSTVADKLRHGSF